MDFVIMILAGLWVLLTVIIGLKILHNAYLFALTVIVGIIYLVFALCINFLGILWGIFSAIGILFFLWFFLLFVFTYCSNEKLSDKRYKEYLNKVNKDDNV